MSAESYAAVRVVGGLLPLDLLSKLSSGDGFGGLTSGDYHLAGGESPREAANRAWSYLTGVWAAYRAALDRLPETDRATSLTRERWLLVLLRELGFGRVPVTGAGGLAADGKSFPVSHAWEHVPVHLLGWPVDLDRRAPGVAGAADASPQSLVQELLNRSDAHLWGLLSNGRVLRLLRDSTSLVGSAYVEFDLEAIFDGELFPEFLLLFLLAHQSRFEKLDAAGTAADCWLERWRTEAEQTGTRALNLLRLGVVAAIDRLGTGFVRANPALRAELGSGGVPLPMFHSALLRAVYRLLFLFVTEDRDALLHPSADVEARERYARFFSTGRLRRLARRRRGGRHGDLWRAVSLVMAGLGSEEGRPEIGLAGIGGLFEPFPAGRLGDLLAGLTLANEDLLAAVRELSLVRERGSGQLRVVDYRNLGATELGSVYESLLEYVPQYDPAAQTFRLARLAGNERKSTGSYYTPSSLVEALLDTALDPVLDEAMDSPSPRAALLRVTVCDPACGSGHFLVAASRRIAKRIAYLDTGDPEPPPSVVRAAMREVVARCIYGVDVNPMAAELAKVSLWLEAFEPGKPLSFLDAHIKVGNSLLGTTPRLLLDGVPDAAFKPIEGDDKKVASALLKRNRSQRSGQLELDVEEGVPVVNETLGASVGAIVEAPAESLADVHALRSRHASLAGSLELARLREVADAWCAAFVWRKTSDAPPSVTDGVLRALAAGPAVPDATRAEVRRLASEYSFFHWHLEFPHIFPVPRGGIGVDERTGWAGGFSCVVGNVPWERIKLQEQEFFAARDPEIAEAPNAAARRKRIAALAKTNPLLFAEFGAAKRRAEGESHLLRSSGRFPLTGRGDINTYAVFAETDRMLTGPVGRVGMICPTGIATDATTQHFFRDLVQSGSLAALYDFENRKPLFEGVDSRFKFCLLTLAGRGWREVASDFAFFLHDPADLAKPDVRFALKPDEITLLNPNTGTLPVFRSRRDAEITLGIYRRVPVLVREGDPDGNPWGLSFLRMFDMANDSHLFRRRAELEAEGWRLDGNVFVRGRDRMLPLYEAKMLHHYDHRWATYDPSGATREVTLEEKQDPNFVALPRYWVAAQHVDAALAGRWDHQWLLGWRDITNTTNERTMISSFLPRFAVNHKLPLALVPELPELLAANWTSMAFDYVCRQKIGGTSMTYFYLKQLPVVAPAAYKMLTPWDTRAKVGAWIRSEVLELAFSADDLTALARYLGNDGRPFQWNPERRALLRAELDAAYFHLYGVDRDDVDYILDTFPIVKRKDEAKYGEYRTKRLILEIYDAMAKAIDTGEPYQTVLDRPAGDQ